MQGEPVDLKEAVSKENATSVAEIRLLSELNEQAYDALVQREGLSKCDVYGPFYSDSSGRDFLRQASRAGIAGTQQEERIKLKPYYRLYVQPQGSKEKTQELINRLRDYQLNAELITAGPLRGAISLGDFESDEEVERLTQRLSVHDLRVERQQKTRDYSQYWVYLNPGSVALLTGSVQTQLIDKYPGIFHQQKSCKPVASAE